jgi:endonuclease IV
VSSRTRVGPARCPSRESPEQAIEILLERGYSACEIDFESGFWMDYPFAERLGQLAGESDIALSVHAPLFGFMGHVEPSGRKFTSAVGALDRSAGIAKTSGAEVVVFHPGFLSNEPANGARCSRGALGLRGASRERISSPRRRVMGRVRDLARSTTSRDLGERWVRPVLDFAHARRATAGFRGERSRPLASVNAVLEAGSVHHFRHHANRQ